MDQKHAGLSSAALGSEHVGLNLTFACGDTLADGVAQIEPRAPYEEIMIRTAIS
jgi:hypothetical protein